MDATDSINTLNATSSRLESADVLLLEDNHLLGDLIEVSLQRRGCCVKRFSHAEDVDTATDAGTPGILVSDLWLMGPMNGVQLIERLRERGDQRPALIISAEPDKKVERAALAAGASGFLPKPFSLDELGRAVESMLTAWSKTPFSAPSNH